MSERRPAAFLSYVHSDDDHDNGRITQLRERLEGEVRMHTGTAFKIFQDRNDLEWGQSWSDRIDESLNIVTFLVPVVTPSYFKSPACRKEFETFHKREQALGTNRLILPIYYLDCDELDESSEDFVGKVLSSRQWSDWRQLRFHDLKGPIVSEHLANQAIMIKRSIKELDSLFSETESSESFDKLLSSHIEDNDSSQKVENGVLQQVHDVDNFLVNVERSTGLEKDYKFTYKVYTKEYDEIVLARDLLTPQESVEFGQRAIELSREISTKNYLSLQRLERGVQSADGLAVVILVDNSGSLRGAPISNIAAWSIVILEYLEKFGITCQLSGFTTRSWKGGRSREKWLQDGRPANPGRLADLRYIIYKDFHDSIAGSAQSIGAMLKEGILKENVDGEAVEWAYDELVRVSEKNKLIIVISDGAPVDDSTLSVNPEGYLSRHLQQVIDASSQSDIGLFAVGIDHDVSMYYGRRGTLATGAVLGLRVLDIVKAHLPKKDAKKLKRSDAATPKKPAAKSSKET